MPAACYIYIMNLKNEFDFIADWFVSNNHFYLKEIVVGDIINYIEISDYRISSVVYSGIVNETVYIFFKNINFSEDVFKKLKNNMSLSLKNIEGIVLKKISIRFSEDVNLKDILEKIKNKGLILNFLYQGEYNLVLFLPYIFIKKFLQDIFKVYENLSILESLRKIKANLYKSDILLYWELKDFINILSNKEIQNFINTLLKNNIIEETMLAALIAGTGEKWIHNKIYLNLSKNMKSEMNYILSNNYPDKRWIDEVLLIVKSSISSMLFREIIRFEKLEYILKLKEKIKIEKYNKIFKEKPFDIWLKEIYDNGLITELRHKAERNLLIKSIADYSEEFLEFYYVGLSSNARSEYKTDFLYFKKHSGKDEIYKSKIKVVEIIKDIYYSGESKKIKYFYDIIKELSSDELEILIMEVGITKFAQATLSANKEFKRDIYALLKGNLRDLMLDIYRGRIRFKSGFGEQTINQNKREIIKTYLYLRDNIF